MGYLMSPYAAAYASANGLSNGSAAMVRSNTGAGSPAISPFLYAAAAASGAAAAAAAGSCSPGLPPSHPPPSASSLNGQAAVSGNPEHALSSPPPAHMGAYLDKSGLRPPPPPIYPLPNGSQYPYSMLGAADQLAAWHQQAALHCYQQVAAEATLRSTSRLAAAAAVSNSFSSSYSLPHLSSSFSPMSAHFSPPGLLSHSNLSPVSGSGSGGHLPHLKHDFHGGKESSNKNKYAKKKEPHIKKPLNAFMIYMKDMRPVVQAECTLKESAAINQLLGRRWHGLSREEQAKYYEKARVERQKHMQMYPHWNARDNYRFGTKKKKRTTTTTTTTATTSASGSTTTYSGGTTKRDYGGGGSSKLEVTTSSSSSLSSSLAPPSSSHQTPFSSNSLIKSSASTSSVATVTAAACYFTDNSMKKCRARFGLDQHNLWCKPCRRKKKCIRLQIHQQQQQLQAQRNFHMQQERKAAGSSGSPPPILDPNPSINELRRLIPTIGMDSGSGGSVHIQQHQQHRPPPPLKRTSVLVPNPLHSPVAAAAAAMDSTSNSETSIRSPSGMSSLPSLGSPSSLASPSSAFTGADSHGDWQFPAATGKSTSSGCQSASLPSAFKPLNSTSQSLSQGFSVGNRPKVGTDPRDSKNPLSVSQMTGNSPKPQSSATSSSSHDHRATNEMNHSSSLYHHNDRTLFA